jgi:4-alpha-glucanotransferase
VGEDLGTVEPWMRQALDKFGILSYRLFYFEKRGDGGFIPAAEYPARALVSSTTHDLPTLAGFWAGVDIETRAKLGLFPDEHSRQQATWFRHQDKLRMLAALRDGGFLPPGFPDSVAEGAELVGELHSAITGFLASTPSLLMTLNQEDLTKELDQQNLPGTTWQYPNWRRKTLLTAEELHSSERARDYAAMLRDWLRRTGRTSDGLARRTDL